jgi:hypothetical protein
MWGNGKSAVLLRFELQEKENHVTCCATCLSLMPSTKDIGVLC